jgi:hypothetical protein
MATSKKKDVNRTIPIENYRRSDGWTAKDNIGDAKELSGHVRKSS